MIVEQKHIFYSPAAILQYLINPLPLYPYPPSPLNYITEIAKWFSQ